MTKLSKYLIIGLVLLLAILYALSYYNPNPLAKDVMIDSIVVIKSARKMIVYSNGDSVKSYTIALGGSPYGKKQVEGDMKTPEGLYFINDKNPHSGYHKNLGISYPNKEDIQHADNLDTSAGGAIKIHGITNRMGFIGNLHKITDWTQGCIAVTNREIDELYEHVVIGSPINILP